MADWRSQLRDKVSAQASSSVPQQLLLARRHVDYLQAEAEQLRAAQLQSDAAKRIAQDALQQQVGTHREAIRALQIELEDLQASREGSERQARLLSAHVVALEVGKAESQTTLASCQQALQAAEELTRGLQAGSLNQRVELLERELSDAEVLCGVREEQRASQQGAMDKIEQQLRQALSDAQDRETALSELRQTGQQQLNEAKTHSLEVECALNANISALAVELRLLQETASEAERQLRATVEQQRLELRGALGVTEMPRSLQIKAGIGPDAPKTLLHLRLKIRIDTDDKAFDEDSWCIC